MSFEQCVVYCAGNEDLVAEFNRLTGHHMGEHRKPLDKMIDEACGRDPDKSAFPAFISFVYNYIWSTLT